MFLDEPGLESETPQFVARVPPGCWAEELRCINNPHVRNETVLCTDDRNQVWNLPKVLEAHYINAVEELRENLSEIFPKEEKNLLPVPLLLEVSNSQGLTCSVFSVVKRSFLYSGKNAALSPNKMIFQVTKLGYEDPIIFCMNVSQDPNPNETARSFMVHIGGKYRKVSNGESRISILKGFKDFNDGKHYPFTMKNALAIYSDIVSS